jgi:hypothetical protein
MRCCSLLSSRARVASWTMASDISHAYTAALSQLWAFSEVKALAHSLHLVPKEILFQFLHSALCLCSSISSSYTAHFCLLSEFYTLAAYIASKPVPAPMSRTATGSEAAWRRTARRRASS